MFIASLVTGYLALVALFFMALWFVLSARYQSNEDFRKFVQNLTRGIFSSGHRRTAYRSIPKTEEDAEEQPVLSADDGDETGTAALVDVEAPASVPETATAESPAPAGADEPRELQEPPWVSAPLASGGGRIAQASQFLEMEVGSEEDASALLPSATRPSPPAAELDDLFGFVPTKSASQPREPLAKEPMW